MPVILGSIVKGKKTTDDTVRIVESFRQAKHTMEHMKRLFESGLDMSRKQRNPFACEHRETYIAKSPTGAGIHRCHFGEKPDALFDRCRSCEIDRCPLTNNQTGG